MSSMFIHHRREKLLNAIAYFLHNTHYCYTLKLFKLLYFLDFEHYRQTGKSVTGLSYQALPMGPVPGELYDEIMKEAGQKNLALEVTATFDDMSGVLCKREFTVKGKFDETYFTPRELQIMERLALFFGEIKSDVMSAHSHNSNLPWKKVYGKGEGKGHIIPYDLALQSEPIVCDELTIEEQEMLMLEDVFEGTGLR